MDLRFPFHSIYGPYLPVLMYTSCFSYFPRKFFEILLFAILSLSNKSSNRYSPCLSLSISILLISSGFIDLNVVSLPIVCLITGPFLPII